MTKNTLCSELYQQYYLDKKNELTDLIRKLSLYYLISSAFYPGSFVDVSPSFVVPHVVYVDNDHKAKEFFADPRTLVFINARKEYVREPTVIFHPCNYNHPFSEKLDSFDLSIS